MKVLVIGSGGREHALCWSFSKSPLCEKLFCAPGNAGISEVATCLPIKIDQIDEILDACNNFDIDFVMIGPELPLTLGLADKLREANIPCFGPSKEAAALEGSKGFMKDLCKRKNIPTADYARFTDAQKAKEYVKEQGAPIVIKADGLSAGKGVTVAQTIEEANKAIDDAMLNKAFGDAGSEIVVEECMFGEEASFFALTDGDNVLYFTTAQDHKAVYDGDKGPNTGGMGAYSPAPNVDKEMHDRIMNEIILPTVEGMKENSTPFSGILYAGLMITETGPRLIEYNARFGDPETQVMIPRLKSDLLAALFATSKGMLDSVELNWYDNNALCVVMAANGYPASYEKGSVIKGLKEANETETGVVFHAGTDKSENGDITANGGRVLGVTGWASTVTDAKEKAYDMISKIDWNSGFCRTDIGWRAVEREKNK